MSYIICITDLAHYMEPEGESTREFATLEEAQSACREIIDRALEELYTSRMSAEELRKQFLTFGEEASCEGFDARQYVEVRIGELCSQP